MIFCSTVHWSFNPFITSSGSSSNNRLSLEGSLSRYSDKAYMITTSSYSETMLGTIYRFGKSSSRHNFESNEDEDDDDI